MHILATSSTGLDDIAEPVDLGQTPGDIVALSFSDSDLAALAAAWRLEHDQQKCEAVLRPGMRKNKKALAGKLPSLRLAPLAQLRHPMSVDLWVESVARHAKVIFVRLLGGLDWWRYGVDQLAAVARVHGIPLAIVPGDARNDPRLAEASTLPPDELARLEAYCTEGGPDNLRALLRCLAAHAGGALDAPEPHPVPRADWYVPLETAPHESLSAPHPDPLPASGERESPGISAFASFRNESRCRKEGRRCHSAPSPRVNGERVGVRGKKETVRDKKENTAPPTILIIFYRSVFLAADTAPVDALCAALRAQGLNPAPLFVASLKEPQSAAFVRVAVERLRPAAIITATAFAMAGEGEAETIFAGSDAPLFQAIMATTKHAAWEVAPRGLGASDLAMHVVLPEVDGRVLLGALSFKAPQEPCPELSFASVINQPEPDRVEMVAARVAAWVRLRALPNAEKRVVVLMPDYPGAGGRAGYAVGLDVPESVRVLLEDLRGEGYKVEGIPASSQELMRNLEAAYLPPGGGGQNLPKQILGEGEEADKGLSSTISPSSGLLRRPPSPARGEGGSFTIEDYKKLLPPNLYKTLTAAWGAPESDPAFHNGAFHFRICIFGNITVALPPDRGSSQNRRADYHDPALPPRPALMAFGLWLQQQADAVVHMGAHGTLEWLPGKAVALTASCFPEAVIGALPVIYPFLVSNPGEAAQAKRRLSAITIGHLPPPLAEAETHGALQKLERLVDEYALADGLDHRRRARLAKLIRETARESGISREAGAEDLSCPDEALRRIDAWLCDVKELALKDGLHIYGRAGADTERTALLSALNGARIAPGPAGAPARGRRDVLPTGRNLFTLDPRTLPTPTAMDLARLAADEVLRQYRQDHGDMPRALVMDLWGSATLRTGGEEIAQALAYLGCVPVWDHATGRVTGVEVQPLAVLGRARVDVSLRLSGLFRDLFPAQIALLDAAVQAVSAREEPDEENPLAAARRRGETPARLFGSAPGAYGAGVEDLLASGAYETRADLGQAYLAAASHLYGGVDGEARPAAPKAFAARVAGANLHVHMADDAGRDLLEGAADASFIGGFAAAAELLGTSPELVVMDTTNPNAPKARHLGTALARVVHGRATSPRYIAGQMRHGPRGASDFAETVDRLIAFAETTTAAPSQLIDALFAAYVLDDDVRAFILRENPAAARAMAARFAFARERGLWHPRRNDVDWGLSALRGEA